MPHQTSYIQYQFKYKLTIEGANPITLDQIKTHLNIPLADDSENTYLTLISNAVVLFTEKYTSRDVRENTYETFRNDFFDPNAHNWSGIEIRRSPLSSVTTIEYLKDTVLTLVASTVYYNTDSTDYSLILLNDGEVWPTDFDNRLQNVKITFVAGFETLPDDLLMAMLNHIAFMYTERGDCTASNCPVDGFLPVNSKNTYSQYRILDIKV